LLIYLQAKKLYEKSHREAERTLELYKKADADIHLSRADVEKVFFDHNCYEVESSY